MSGLPDTPSLIPNDAQVAQIKDLISDLSAKDATIEQDLQRARALCKELEEKHEKLVQEMDRYRGLISPLRRGLLPVEIMQEIFLHCLPTEHGAIMHPKEAPILLTLVCKGWRQVALSTPQLWASIHVAVPAPLFFSEQQDGIVNDHNARCEEVVQRRVVTLERWLKLSKGHPLSITIGDSNLPDNTYCSTFLDAIIPHVNRWRKLVLYTYGKHNQRITCLSAEDAPLLECLQINESGYHEDFPPNEVQASPWRTSSLLSSPNLRQVFIIRVPDQVRLLPISWAGLTHLRIFSGLRDVEDALQLMKRCPQLKIFEYSIDHQDLEGLAHNSQQDDKMSFPDLYRLSVSDISVCRDAHAFDSIETPSLRELSYVWPASVASPIISILVKAGRNLRQFKTNSLYFAGQDFITCLQCCPNLVKLQLPHPVVYDPDQHLRDDIGTKGELLRLLSTPDEEGQYLCPMLEEFEITTQAKFTEEDIIEFIAQKQSGKPGLAKLKRFIAVLSRYQKTPLAAALKRYRDEGLEIKLSFFERRGSMMDMDVLSPYQNLNTGGEWNPTYYESEIF